MRKHLYLIGALMIMFSMMLGACQPAAPVAPKVLVHNLGVGDIPTIDPALATDSSSIQVVQEINVGLSRQDEVTSAIEPGMATEWTMSEDGKTYTFKLRNDVPWVKYDTETGKVVKVQDCDGKDRMVKAQDFVYGVLRTLNPVTASDYAYVLGFALEGANAYNIGEGPVEDVKIKAVDDYTLEMTFVEPAVYNLNIAGMWVAHPQPAWLIDGDACTEAAGERWTETMQSFGPYAVKEWVHDDHLTMVKNPFWPGADNIPVAKIDEVKLTMLEEGAAMAEYEAGNQSYVNVPLADMDRVKTDPVLSKELYIGPSLCTYYYGFNTMAPFTDDVRVRRALSMAIDRQALIDNVTKGEQQPAQWFSRPGLDGAPTMEKYPDLGVKSDPVAAKASLQEYMTEKGITEADVDITLMFNTNEGHQKIAEAIQQMWKDNLGIDVKVVNQEWAVYLDTIRGAETPQIYRLGWCQDYPDANNFIREVFTLGGSANPGDPEDPTKPLGGVAWYNADFEALVRAAAVEQDRDKRMQMYADAEEMLVWTDAVMAPIYWYTTVTVTKPNVTRTNAVINEQRYEKWDMTTEAQ